MRIDRRRIAVFYQADAYGRSGWAGVRSALKRHGERIAGEATYRRGERFTGTMRKQVEILKAAKPEAVICIGAYAACAAFARDAVDLGLQVPFANLSFVGSGNLLKLLTGGRDDTRRYTRWLVNSQVVPSVPSQKYVAIFPPIHPSSRRCLHSPYTTGTTRTGAWFAGRLGGPILSTNLCDGTLVTRIYPYPRFRSIAT